MEVIYRAYNGKEFHTKEECELYEASHCNGMLAFDRDLKPIKGNEIINRIDDILCIKFETEQDAYDFDYMCEETCRDGICYSSYASPDKGIFFWDDENCGNWRNLEEELQKLNTLKALFE